MKKKISQDTKLSELVEIMREYRQETGRNAHIEGTGDGKVNIVFEGK